MLKATAARPPLKASAVMRQWARAEVVSEAAEAEAAVVEVSMAAGAAVVTGDIERKKRPAFDERFV